MRWRRKSGVVDQGSIVDLFEAVWRLVVGGGRGPRRDLVLVAAVAALQQPLAALRRLAALRCLTALAVAALAVE